MIKYLRMSKNPCTGDYIRIGQRVYIFGRAGQEVLSDINNKILEPGWFGKSIIVGRSIFAYFTRKHLVKAINSQTSETGVSAHLDGVTLVVKLSDESAPDREMKVSEFLTSGTDVWLPPNTCEQNFSKKRCYLFRLFAALFLPQSISREVYFTIESIPFGWIIVVLAVAVNLLLRAF